MPQSMANTKLRLLYLMQEVSLPLTSEQLLRACSNYDWINYFELKQSLLELVETKMLVQSRSPNGDVYILQPLALQSLQHFQRDIPFSIRRILSEDAKKLRDTVRIESECIADYEQIDQNKYRVTLMALEKGEPLLNITVVAHTMQQAQDICDNWPFNVSSIYSLLMQTEE